MKRLSILCIALFCAGLAYGASLRIPPARSIPITVRAASVASTGTVATVSFPLANLRASWTHSAKNGYNYSHSSGQPGVWTDSSGGGNNLTDTDAIAPTASTSGTVWASNRLQNASEFARDAGDVTIVIHARPGTNASVPDYVLFCRNPDNSMLTGYVYNHQAYIKDNAGGGALAGSTDTPWHDQWITVVFRFSATTGAVYRNGSLWQNLNTTKGTGNTFTVGAFAARTFAFIGTIDAILYYNAALTNAQCVDSPNWF